MTNIFKDETVSNLNDLDDTVLAIDHKVDKLLNKLILYVNQGHVECRKDADPKDVDMVFSANTGFENSTDPGVKRYGIKFHEDIEPPLRQEIER